MINVTLDRDSAAVLLRCLGYGALAISRVEDENGIGELIRDKVVEIRQSVSRELAADIINDVVEFKKN